MGEAKNWREDMAIAKREPCQRRAWLLAAAELYSTALKYYTNEQIGQIL